MGFSSYRYNDWPAMKYFVFKDYNFNAQRNRRKSSYRNIWIGTPNISQPFVVFFGSKIAQKISRKIEFQTLCILTTLCKVFQSNSHNRQHKRWPHTRDVPVLKVHKRCSSVKGSKGTEASGASSSSTGRRAFQLFCLESEWEKNLLILLVSNILLIF